MSSKISNALISILFFSGLVLVGNSLYKMYFQQKNTKAAPASVVELKKMQAHDFKTLNSSDATDEQIIAALRRYTVQNLPESENFIKKHSLNADVKVKAAALEASGAYAWATAESFRAALMSESQVLQEAAISGLGKRSDSDRLKLLQEYLENKKLIHDRWLSAKITEHKLVRDQNSKDVILKEILKRVIKASTQQQMKVYGELFMIAPNQMDLIAEARAVIISNPNDDLAGAAFRYSSAFDQAWLQEKLIDLNVRKNYNFQMAVLDFLFANCPNHWESIENKIRSNSASSIVLSRLTTNPLKVKCGAR